MIKSNSIKQSLNNKKSKTNRINIASNKKKVVKMKSFNQNIKDKTKSNLTDTTNKKNILKMSTNLKLISNNTTNNNTEKKIINIDSFTNLNLLNLSIKKDKESSISLSGLKQIKINTSSRNKNICNNVNYNNKSNRTLTNLNNFQTFSIPNLKEVNDALVNSIKNNIRKQRKNNNKSINIYDNLQKLYSLRTNHSLLEKFNEEDNKDASRFNNTLNSSNFNKKLNINKLITVNRTNDLLNDIKKKNKNYNVDDINLSINFYHTKNCLKNNIVNNKNKIKNNKKKINCRFSSLDTEYISENANKNNVKKSGKNLSDIPEKLQFAKNNKIRLYKNCISSKANQMIMNNTKYSNTNTISNKCLYKNLSPSLYRNKFINYNFDKTNSFRQNEDSFSNNNYTYNNINDYKEKKKSQKKYSSNKGVINKEIKNNKNNFQVNGSKQSKKTLNKIHTNMTKVHKPYYTKIVSAVNINSTKNKIIKSKDKINEKIKNKKSSSKSNNLIINMTNKYKENTNLFNHNTNIPISTNTNTNLNSKKEIYKKKHIKNIIINDNNINSNKIIKEPIYKVFHTITNIDISKLKLSSDKKRDITQNLTNLSFNNNELINKNEISALNLSNRSKEIISNKLLNLTLNINNTNINISYNNNDINSNNNNDNIIPKAEIKMNLNENQIENEENENEKIKFTGKITDYIIKDILGRGSYAIVKLGIHIQSSLKVAIKIYDKSLLKDLEKRNTIRREIEVLKIMNHKSIIKLYEIIHDVKKIYLITELVNGISLLEFIKLQPNNRIPESICKKLFKQIVVAINYCHNNNICHRDIKLENILLADNNQTVKIIDFGFGAKLSSKNSIQKFFCGTPSYMSPEIVQKKSYYALPTDIWSLGILLYTMLCGAFPFMGSSERDLIHKIRKGEFTLPSYLGSKVGLLIKRILKVKPNDRPTAGDILEDEWLNS